MGKNLKNKLPKEELIRLYKIEGHSLGDIAKIYNVSRVAIMKYCNILGVERRGKGKARVLAQKKGKIEKQRYCAINEAFFGSWSPQMAYILGLLMTDGCISSTKNGSYRISLCLNDKDLLLEVAKTLGSDHTITESKYQKGLNVFIFGRKKIALDLLRLGMKPRKSLDLEFPEIPDEYLRDFIRGVFDGDGSVFYNPKNIKSPLRTNFTSGSKTFMTELEKSLESLGMKKKVISEMRGKHPAFRITYCHKDSLQLYKIMYENLQNSLYMNRKYDKFKAVIDNEKIS